MRRRAVSFSLCWLDREEEEGEDEEEEGEEEEEAATAVIFFSFVPTGTFLGSKPRRVYPSSRLHQQLIGRFVPVWFNFSGERQQKQLL